jgi:PAS domain S-box-containing protein
MCMDSPLLNGMPPGESWYERSNSLLQAILQSSDDAIIAKDLDGHVTSWNPAATRIFGYLPKEMIGQSILRIIPPHLHHEEQMILTRLRAGDQISHYETVRVRKDGGQIVVSLTISPVRDESGDIVGISKIARDITEQKQLNLARYWLSAIVESADDAILSKDLNGIITSWNRAAQRIFGYTEEEMVGASVLKLIPQELHPEEQFILSKLRAGDKIDHYETTRVTKTGERLNVSLTISPLRDSSGKIIGASKILRDITKQRHLEESLVQAEKLAAGGRMAATIAHEINNPLEAVLNLIYLARSISADPQVQDYLQSAENELGRLAEIAKQTLGFYRDHASAVKVSLPELIGDTLRIYDAKLKAAGIRLETRFASTREIVVKRGEIMQVIANLISNSTHAMPSGGKLVAAVEDASLEGHDALQVTIEDSGVGIQQQHLQRVFEPFYTTRTTVGTGIGLWVVKQFIDGHAGKIAVHSSTEPASHGTKIVILLPFDNPFSSRAA